MYCCKDFYSLSVLSLYEGELIGAVDKLYVDKKLKRLCQIELVGADGAKLILPTKNIYHVGKNAITVKNNQEVSILTEKNDCCVVPIASKAYSISGEFLGVIEEISFNEKFITQKISLDNNEIMDVKNIASIGKNVVVFCSNNDRCVIKNFTPQNQPKNFKQEENQVAETMPVEKPKDNVENAKVPTIQNSDFLLGRICTKDIFNFNNELLIKAHAVVNKRNIKEIKKFGKLRELMIYSK